ncbi:DUF1561 domain-containing protein [Leptospira noguchii]|uniref:DUF1561 domain-containing protein n=2 Tax=Leptospira noguchii TaxID=28182 RepID=UPI001FB6E9DC|nr:DUF1561 domain-containing protein [Leptospira noguchii]UOG60196.1 DUF1561 domain-containing protein [Leptospira noguchii]
MYNWKKMLIVVLLVSIGVGFEYGESHTRVHAASSSKSNYSIVQRPTDKPKDKPIQVVVSDGGKFCYGPIFSGGESYIQIEQCWERHVKNARYDVFQRISYYIEDTWLCITAPETVIRGEEPWDYVNLRPCTINDPQQRWIVKENSFWTADGNYRLKDTNWYGYISRNSGDKYNHTLDSSMNDWVKTVATPGNISIKTSIAWDLQTTYGNERYFVRWGGSDKNTTPIYYNPESGHLAQYNPVSGLLSCMYSQVGESNWNWVKWAFCSDAAISKDNPAFWNVYLETEEGGMITDYKGNALRVTRYGPNWGVVYAVKPSYLDKDTTNSPISLFVVDEDLLNWTRYTSSNLGKTGQYCPAGNKESLGRKRVKRGLPSDFQLTEEWIQRLYDIATSVSAESETRVSGFCGPCALHSFQMLAELQDRHSQEPLQSGGYFFDTAPNTDPFISFSQRYPHLERLLEDVPKKYAPYPQYSTQSFLSFASIDTMLPQYFWSASTEFTNRDEILSHISSLINSPAGSIWFGVMERQHPDGITRGHAVPILRISQGLVVIPTNVRLWTLETFRRFLVPTTDPSQVIANLEGPNTLTRFTTIQSLGMLTTNMFDSMVSNRNCTGEGEDRRGSGEYPTSTSVNQCPSGRCALPF